MVKFCGDKQEEVSVKKNVKELRVMIAGLLENSIEE